MFWKLLSETLQEWGFTQPIQQMRSKQKHRRKTMHNNLACRLPKISHRKKEVVEDILKKLTDKLGQESPLTTCRGKS